MSPIRTVLEATLTCAIGLGTLERETPNQQDRYLVDPASSHMLV